MVSHWLSEDGMLAMEIIWPIVLDDETTIETRADIDTGEPRFVADCDRGIPDSLGGCAADWRAEEWLHERRIACAFRLDEKDWVCVSRRAGRPTVGPYRDKSQTLIAAVLAAEDAT